MSLVYGIVRLGSKAFPLGSVLWSYLFWGERDSGPVGWCFDQQRNIMWYQESRTPDTGYHGAASILEVGRVGFIEKGQCLWADCSEPAYPTTNSPPWGKQRAASHSTNRHLSDFFKAKKTKNMEIEERRRNPLPWWRLGQRHWVQTVPFLLEGLTRELWKVFKR